MPCSACGWTGEHAASCWRGRFHSVALLYYADSKAPTPRFTDDELRSALEYYERVTVSGTLGVTMILSELLALRDLERAAREVVECWTDHDKAQLVAALAALDKVGGE